MPRLSFSKLVVVFLLPEGTSTPSPRQLRNHPRSRPRKEGELELDLEATIDATTKNAGDIEVIERPPRRNDVRMLLLLDVGGTMDQKYSVSKQLRDRPRSRP